MQRLSWQQSSSDVPLPLSKIFIADILTGVISDLSEQADKIEEKAIKIIIMNFMESR